jgi:hypothetical protein
MSEPKKIKRCRACRAPMVEVRPQVWACSRCNYLEDEPARKFLDEVESMIPGFPKRR